MTGPTERPTGTVTFLFSDIEGSTRLVQALGAESYGTLLERHRRTLRDAFRVAGGIEIGTEGDSFFVVFERASLAVAAAVDGQRRLAREPWPEGAEVRVRMGIHTGEGVLADGTYVGTDVNRAARIAAAGHGGQVLLSEASRSVAEAALPAGTTLRLLGEHRLKDLQPERLYQLEIQGLPAEFPPVRSLEARPNNLPTQLTSFIGRERELQEAADLLASTRLLTLTGPGGTGKTRLALQLAATVADRFTDGVFFVALEPVREPALVPSRIASTLGIVESGNRPAFDLVVEWLAGRHALLVLDNFEQVLGAGPIVADLLRAVEGPSILVTSRAALRVSGEQEYPVPGLPVPPDPSRLGALEAEQLPAPLREHDPAALAQFEAVRLFVARAAAVRPSFALTRENTAAVAAISARLHGMPLAIELAAARVKILSPDAILARLDHQLQVLSGGSRDLPERQQTLRGAIAWSYDLLDGGLRRLLDRLSVFRGGCDLEAAEAVCGPSTEIGIDVLDGLMTLADQSLLRSEERDGETRFRLLETIREFAAERLEARGEATEIRRRHAEVFCSRAHRAAGELAGDEQRAWLERLEREHDNIRAVLDFTISEGDAETAIPLAFAMWRFWQKRGHLPEARQRLDAIAGQPWSHARPELRARLMEALGGVAWWQADLPAMRTHYDEALELWRGLGDRAEVANALYNASFFYTVSDNQNIDVDPTGEGRRRMEEAYELYTELGDEHGQGNVLWAIGNYDYFRDRDDAGIERFRRALEAFRRTGDQTMEAWSLHMLGSALLRRGHVDEARELTRHALRHFHEASDAAGLTMVLDDLSAVATAEGDLPRAARLRGAARRLTSATGVGLAGFVEDAFEHGVRPSARRSMSPEELERYGAEGAAMSIDEAVAYALDESIESLRQSHSHAPA